MTTTPYNIPWDGARGGFPSALGEGISNGHAASSDPIETLEAACLHLAGSRKIFIPGPIGYIQSTVALKWFFFIRRENYTQNANLVLWVSASDSRSYMSVRVVVSDTSHDETATGIPTGSPSAIGDMEHMIPFVIGAGDNTDSDDALAVTVTVTPGSDNAGVTADFVLWSMGILVEPMEQIGVVT